MANTNFYAWFKDPSGQFKTLSGTTEAEVKQAGTEKGWSFAVGQIGSFPAQPSPQPIETNQAAFLQKTSAYTPPAGYVKIPDVASISQYEKGTLGWQYDPSGGMYGIPKVAGTSTPPTGVPKEYYYKGTDIYEAGTNRYIPATEWQNQWVGQPKQAVSAPAPTPTPTQVSAEWLGDTNIPPKKLYGTSEEDIKQQAISMGVNPVNLQNWKAEKAPVEEAIPTAEIEAEVKKKAEILEGEGKRLYIQKPDGTIEWIKDEAELDKVKKEYNIPAGTAYTPMTETQKNTSRLLEDIVGTTKRGGDFINLLTTSIDDFVKAGFKAEDIENLISYAKGVETPSEVATRVEKGFATEKEQIETKIKTYENSLIDYINGRTSLVTTFDTYFKDAKLDTLSTEISQLDTNITNAKAERDASLLDISGKIIPQWMITGEKQLEVQRSNDSLNQLINQRNDKATEYNKKWDEILARVGLVEKESSIHANGLKDILEVYSGKREAVNKKILEKLSSEGVANIEERERMLEQIKLGMAPTSATIVEEALKANMSKQSKIIDGGSQLGIWYWDNENKTLKPLVEGVGETEAKTTEAEYGRKMSQYVVSEFDKYVNQYGDVPPAIWNDLLKDWTSQNKSLIDFVTNFSSYMDEKIYDQYIGGAIWKLATTPKK